MPVRTNGGVFSDQVLTGSLHHYRIIGADFSNAVDAFGQPVHGSAAEIIFTMLSERATLSIMNPITNPLGISLALETNRADWTAARMEADIRALGTIGVDAVDVSTITVENVYYNLIPTGGGGSSDFLGLTDTPPNYTGAAGQVATVNAAENALEFTTATSPVTIATINGQETVVVVDTARSKTLSVSENPVMFSDNRLDNLQWIRIGNTNHANSGYMADFDGTLTYASAQCENTNAFSKDIHVFINGTDAGNLGTLSGGIDASFINTTLNIDFNQGDKIRLRALDGTPGKIEDTVVKLVLRWRA